MFWVRGEEDEKWDCMIKMRGDRGAPCFITSLCWSCKLSSAGGRSYIDTGRLVEIHFKLELSYWRVWYTDCCPCTNAWLILCFFLIGFYCIFLNKGTVYCHAVMLSRVNYKMNSINLSKCWIQILLLCTVSRLLPVLLLNTAQNISATDTSHWESY